MYYDRADPRVIERGRAKLAEGSVARKCFEHILEKGLPSQSAREWFEALKDQNFSDCIFEVILSHTNNLINA